MSRFTRLRSSFQETFDRRRSRAPVTIDPLNPPGTSASPTVQPQQPTHQQPTRYTVVFLSQKLGLRLERSIFTTRGAYVTGFTTNDEDTGVSRGGLARDIRVGDNLLEVNGESLLLPTLDGIILKIGESDERPTTLLFEKQSANRAGFAAIIRRGSPGLSHFLDFVLSNSKKDSDYANSYRPSLIFYIEALSFQKKLKQKSLNPRQRVKCARLLFQTFLDSSTSGISASWYIPISVVGEGLRDNVRTLLGLVKAKVLLDIPFDLFDECMCSVAKSLSSILSPFCKSTNFQHLKSKRPPFHIGLDHILQSRRAINFFLCYLLQTRCHSELCCYLDLRDLNSGAIDISTIHAKYFASSAPLPVTCIDFALPAANAVVRDDEICTIEKSLLKCLENDVLKRFVHSEICQLLVLPAEKMGDLSNILDVSCLAPGLFGHRRPTKRDKMKKANEPEQEEQEQEQEQQAQEQKQTQQSNDTACIATGTVAACVLFECDLNSGKIQIVETLKKTNETETETDLDPLPKVAPFLIPHGVNCDIDYHATNKQNLEKEKDSILIPGSFAMSLQFATPGGLVPSWSCSVLVHPSEPSTSLINNLTSTRLVPGGIALFSKSACQCRLRKRLSAFARRTSSDSSTSLHDNVRASQTMLLADVEDLDLAEDASMFMEMMLESLSGKTLVDFFHCALLERKILMISKSYTLLTATASAIKQLLDPLAWSHVLIPVLPREMIETLECPSPFIIGIHSSYAFKRDFPFVLDLVVLDLDSGTLTMQQANAEMLDDNDEADELYAAVNAAIQAPPSQDETQLLQDLKDALCVTSSAADSVAWPPLARQRPALSVKRLFRDYVSDLLEGVESFCVPMSHGRESNVVFDRQGFVARHASDSYPLMNALVQTGCFNRYVTDTAGTAPALKRVTVT